MAQCPFHSHCGEEEMFLILEQVCSGKMTRDFG